ncbi:MAG: hypothetical protein LBC58_03475 [Clostridiales Family XIII bacterium]|jgi:niacin transporter|nr:hypothetical protein [Clostridiales Family XIII bacterium]
MSKWTTQKLTVTALLIAIGILIPMISPLRVLIEPMSFTLASHVAIFIAVFMAPDAAVVVALGTTLGFFVGGFPLVIVLRAASHVVFALCASLFLKRFPGTLYSLPRVHVFSFIVGLIHGACEVIVVFFYYYTVGGMASVSDNLGFRVLFMLVGIGSVVHSMVDFEIAYGIFRGLVKVRSFASVFPYTRDPRLSTPKESSSPAA